MTPPDDRASRVTIRVFATAIDAARAAGDVFVRAAVEAIERKGRFDVALAGGSTPRAMYELLASERRDDVRWPKVRVFFGDERCVPPDHPDSNYRMACESLLSHVNVCPNCVYRIPGELEPQRAADEYEQALRGHFAEPGDGFDLVLLGMGDDGHTASLFPATAALAERDRWCAANWVPQHDAHRVTLTFDIINGARGVAFLVAGAPKAAALRDVLCGSRDVQRLPAQGVRPRHGELMWMLDAAAGSQLPAELVRGA